MTSIGACRAGLVKELKAKLQEKKLRLEQAYKAFKEKIDSFVQEIKSQKGLNYNTFEEASKDPLIKNMLGAIQKAKAYKDIIYRELEKTTSAITELEGLETRLDLDHAMYKVFDEDRITELSAELDPIIKEIQPTSEDLAIHDKEAELTPLKDIYEEYIEEKVQQPTPTKKMPPLTYEIQKPRKDEESIVEPHALIIELDEYVLHFKPATDAKTKKTTKHKKEYWIEKQDGSYYYCSEKENCHIVNNTEINPDFYNRPEQTSYKSKKKDYWLEIRKDHKRLCSDNHGCYIF